MDYKLIVFDVDGTLVTTKSGADFRKSADDWQWLPGRREKLLEIASRWEAQRIRTAIATNQGGVAFGYMEESDVRAEIMAVVLEGKISASRVCYNHPNATIPRYRKDDPCRKPGPKMLLELMHVTAISPEETLFVGDRPEDEQAAHNAGVAFMWAEDFFTLD